MLQNGKILLFFFHETFVQEHIPTMFTTTMEWCVFIILIMCNVTIILIYECLDLV